MAVPTVITDLSVTAASNSPAGADTVTSSTGPDEYFRALSAIVRRTQAQATVVASASTVDLGAVTSGDYFHISGTTTITAFGTVAAGIKRVLVFDGALILTHNATSLILPAGSNMTTVAGDIFEFISEGSGNWRCINATGFSTTATTLQTARNINRLSFNGSANINISGAPYYNSATGQTSSQSSTSTDLNLCIHAGDYNFADTSTNKPSGITGWGFLRVARHLNDASGSVYIHQTAYDMNGSAVAAVYIRRGVPLTGYTATFSPWLRVIDETNGVFTVTVSGATATGTTTTSAMVGVASSSGTGVYGSSSSGYGVYGNSTSNAGVYGNSSSGYGVYGNSTSSIGVYGNSSSHVGVYGASTTGPALVVATQSAAPTTNLANGAISIGGTTGAINVYIGGAWYHLAIGTAGWVA